jgi:hypothetical protein
MRNGSKLRSLVTLGMLAALWLNGGITVSANEVAGPKTSGTELDRGYLGLYNLDFAGARKNFAAWQAEHPDDPMGAVSEAAGFLFSEFDRLGVLEAQFFENDEAFTERPKVSPDAGLRDRFRSAIDRAETLAHSSLNRNGKDQNALLALTLSSGLQADYAALIEKRNLASLHYAKQAAVWAEQLLMVCPDCYDAEVATGFSKYVIGCMPMPVRWLLKVGGLPGDKQGGIADLQMTAQHGHYLAPFARILLAIAYVRERDPGKARELLAGLHAEFPGNTLFPREIARLKNAH